MGRHTTEAEVDAVLALLPALVERLRAASPAYEDYLAGRTS
jgi:cysteine sulfinate desulfinase/cysteine desulfurase-like protein